MSSVKPRIVNSEKAGPGRVVGEVLESIYMCADEAEEYVEDTASDELHPVKEEIK